MALNNAMMEKLAVAQRKMERIMLGIIRQETGVSDINNTVRKAKHR